MKRIRALLVGVATYSNKRVEVVGGKKKKVNKSMPSAKRDVAAMEGVIKSLPYFSRVDCRVRVEPGETDHRTMLADFEWLFDGAGPDDQLVFYFSGHGGRAVNSAAMNLTTHMQEVLCPSDTDWSRVFIPDRELMERADRALSDGACLEIVLETCSAAGIATAQPLRPFGSFFAPKGPYAGRGAVWCACSADENSHSGPPTACSPTEPVVGLFTHYFCEGLRVSPPLIRGELLEQTAKRLETYFKVANRSCCEGVGPQTPRLIIKPSATELEPLSGNCPVKW